MLVFLQKRRLANSAGTLNDVPVSPPETRPVRVQAPDHGESYSEIEAPAERGAAAPAERAIVAHRKGPAGRGRPAVKTVAAPTVEGLPGRVRGLEKKVGVTVVIAHDKD